MRNYRSISSPDSWTYVFVKNLSEGADADKPNLNDGVLFSFESYAQGLGYRSSDQTLWGVEHNFSKLSKYSITGELLDFWNLYSGSNGCEIDGDNDDFLWVTTRFSAVEKYRLSTKTNVPESKFENMSEYGGYVNSVNGICAPAGEFIYFGISGDGIVRKARKVDGVIIADYPVSDEPSDLAWDGENIWVSYATNPRIDCYKPSDFSLISTFNGAYAAHQGLTWDGNNLWVSYPAGNDGNGIIAKLGNSSSSPAKIYYATDTETLYWNVDGQWQEVPKGTGVDNFLGLIDSPDIDTYEGQSGKMLVVNATEDGLELVSPPEPLPPESAGVSGISKYGAAAMTGDIVFEAGDNVTITQDDTAKKIIISSVAVEPAPTEPTPTLNGMTGDIIIEAGENVTVTEDTTNKKIIIAATAIESVDASSLNGIPVNTDTLADGYVLTYDALTGKIMLKPKPMEGGGGGHLIGIHTLMNISSKQLTNAQYGTNAPINVASSTILKP